MVRREFLRLATLGAAGIGGMRYAASWSAASPVARSGPWLPGAIKIGQGGLIFHGQPFVVRGVVYQPTPVGEDPTLNDGLLSAYADPRIRQRDFPLLRKMGANAIRIYQPRDLLPEFFRASLDAGLYVVLGYNVDTRYDFTADWARRRIEEEFRQFIRTWRGQPSIMLWAIGNGVNEELRRTGRAAHLKAWHSLADAMAKAAHEEEQGQGRPVLLVSSETADIGVPSLGSDDAAMPNLDLWGVNAYRGSSFGSLFEELKTAKPMLMTEYGLDVRLRGVAPELDQIPRAHTLVNLWHEIASRPDKAIGGCLFEFCDEWWRTQPGRPDWHDWGGARVEALPNGVANLEWFGLYGVMPNGNGLNRLTERPAARYLTKAWSPVTTVGQPAVWFDAPLARDRVDARQRVSGRYSGLQPGWEIFLTVQPVGSPVLLVQPEGSVVRAQSGSWVIAAELGPKQPPPDLSLELSTLVAKTPEASALLRDVARGRANSLPERDLIGHQEAVRVRRR